MKKLAGDIIILHMCTKNHNHMVYGSWDMECNRENFLSFSTVFCPYTPLTTQKIKIFKKMEKLPGHIILHRCNINDSHMMYGSQDTKRDRQNFLSFWKSKFWKTEKKIWRYYHFTHVYHKWQSYDVWFLRYGAWQTNFFVILDIFLPFYAPNNPKNKNFEKLKKTPGNITILHKCTAKWGNIEQWGDTEQSYPFHGNSLNSAYNSHITRCLCFRLLTEGFCSPTSKFLKYPHNLWPSFFAKTTIFKWKKFNV